MTVQEMKTFKQEYGLSNQEISARSGLPVSTLQRIFSGETKSPRRETLQALEKALLSILSGPSSGEGSVSMQETALAYKEKQPGEFTLDDYYALPDERRVELIDGVFYDMSAPSLRHQKILGQLHLQFQACADDNAPYGGIGGYQVLQISGVRKYRAWFYPKVKASMPDFDGSTKGNSISFGTQPIKMKVAAPKFGPWYVAKEFDTEAEAKTYIDGKVGLAASPAVNPVQT